MLKTLFCNVHEGTGSEQKYCYGPFQKLVRNSEYSKSNKLKKPSVLPNVLSFFYNYMHRDLATSPFRLPAIDLENLMKPF